MATHRYWRLYVLSAIAAQAPEVGSLELRDVLGGANLSVTGSGTASASTIVNATYAASKAFDSDVATFWSANAAAPQWVKWDFGAGNEKDIIDVTVVKATGSTSPSANGYLQYSDDDITWVTTIWVRSVSAGVYTYTPAKIATASITAPSPLAVGYSGGAATPSAPAPALSAFGGASAAIIAPSAVLRASAGAYARLVGPFQTLNATGHHSTGEQAADLTSPSPSLSAYGGAHAKLSNPSPTLVSTATVTNWGKAALTAPAPTLSADGTVAATARASLTAPMARLVGYSGAVCNITLTGRAMLQASGTTGSVGRAALVCPLFELTASGTAQNHGSADLLAPSPRMGATAQAWLVAPGATLTAIGTTTITATYEAYAINLQHSDPAAPDEVTRYTNFPFHGVVRHQGSYYGWGDGGLYLLEGTVDVATPIPWAIKTAPTDLKSPKEKRPVAAYFGGRLGPASTITLYPGEGSGTSYAHTTPRGALAQNHRQTFGLGIKARYFALGAAGTGVLKLDNIEFDFPPLTRRI